MAVCGMAMGAPALTGTERLTGVNPLFVYAPLAGTDGAA